jgi:DNA-binding SARP family transcriptional activator
MSRPAIGVAAPGIESERVHLQLLGHFELRHRGQVVLLPAGTQHPLAFVALHDRPVMRSLVAGSLWPEVTEDRARANLRSALWRLGRGLSRHRCAVLVARNDRLELAPHVQVDLRRSASLAWRLLQPTAPLEEGELSHDPFASDLLPDWTDDWVVMERERFRQLRLHALEALSLRLAEAGKYGQAVEAGLAAVAAEPLRESAHRILIRVHLAEGNQSEAVRHYQLFRDLLRAELGVDPSFDLAEATHAE